MSSTALANDGTMPSADEATAYCRNRYVIPDLRVSVARLAGLEDATGYMRDSNSPEQPDSLISVHIVNNQVENRRGHRTFLNHSLGPALLDPVE